MFAYQLKKNLIPVLHIENPVYYLDVENNQVFIRKTESGLLNLTYILKFVDHESDFIGNVTILAFYEDSKRKHLTGLISLLFFFLGPVIRYMLINGYSYLPLFDFYKLGYFAKLQKSCLQ